jgi:hypothetical protein
MMAKIQHPWQVGPTELIEFALERMHKGEDFDRRLAFLILDVGVETLFKTYLTLPDGVTQFQIKRSERYEAVDGNFHELLRAVQNANPKKATAVNFAYIEHYHNLRNTLYHQGNQVTAVPMHQLEGYARLAVNVIKTYLDVDLSKKLKAPMPPAESTRTDRTKMLSKCPPEASQFFSHILDAAEKQGHTTYWGTIGFSIRAHVPGPDSLASIAYCYPPNKFQIYFAHLPFSEEKTSTLRKEILEFGIFKESPKTLTVNLQAENIQRAKDAYAMMARRVAELSDSEGEK